jgi:HEPN domain-containing protein
MFGIDLPIVWLYYADGSYLATRLLWFTNFMVEALVNSHRTIELYLKTYLVSKRQVVKKGEHSWGHNLQQLANLCAGFDNDFKNIQLSRRIVFYQRYHELVRYPSEIKGQLQDGSLIWFSFDSAILPLDELVAFIRPRITLSEDEWKKSRINILFQDDRPEFSFQRRALIDTNKHLQQIVCSITHNAQIEFDPNFRLDLPGC